MSTEEKPKTGTVEEAAMAIFDALPEDPFGEQEPEDPAGSEEAPPAGDEESEDFDQEAVHALQDEEAEAEEEVGDYESEDDDEAELPAEEPEPSTFTVKVDGEEVEVPLDELLAGYSRTASWTRKSQALAEERKAFEQEQREIREERMRYAQGIQELENQLRAQLPQEPRSNDPKEWVEYQRKRQEMEKVAAERQRLQQRLQEDFEAERQRIIEQEAAKLPQMIPEWSDSEKAKQEKADLFKYAVGLGFSEDEVSNVADARIVYLLRNAMLYEQLQKKAPEVKQKTAAAPTLKPGQPKGRAAKTTQRKKQRSQREKLRKSGRLQDAAALIHDTMLD